MSQSLCKIFLHIIFGTKNREPYIDDTICGELCSYLTTVLKNLDCDVIAINAPKNHIHTLCELSKDITIPSLIEKMKTTTSRWIKTKGLKFRNFHWQGGYGVFSVSPSLIESAKKYIFNQQEHHRKKTFQDEFRQFLKKYGVKYDEKYVWD